MMTNAPKKIKKGTAVTLLYPQKKGPFLQTKLQIPAKKNATLKRRILDFLRYPEDLILANNSKMEINEVA